MTNTIRHEMVVNSSTSLAEAFLQSRIASGKSQQEIADEMDIHRSYISRMETGEISTTVLERMIERLTLCGARITISFDEEV